MPSPGATPVEGQDAMDLGGGLAATKYSDGSLVVWKITPPNDEVAYIEAGRQDPADLGDGRAAYVKPDGSIDVFDINNPPPSYAGNAPGAPAGAGAAGQGTAAARPPAQPQAYAGIRTPGPGGYSNLLSGLPQGKVAPDTRFPGGGVNAYGERYFEGRPDFGGPLGWGNQFVDRGTGYTYLGQAPNVGGLQGLAPGAMREAGRDRTYQPYYGGQPFRFTSQGLNVDYGSGGQGDPTTNTATTQAQFNPYPKGPDDWMRWVQGTAGGGGGGGWDQSWQAAVPGYAPGPGVSAPSAQLASAGFGASTPTAAQGFLQRGTGGGGGAGGGTGGGYFSATRPWENLSGDYAPLANLVLRSDTPTGLGTAGIPPEYQNLLRQALAQGIITASPQGWSFMQQTYGWTPQSVGGAAATSGGAGAGAGGTQSTGDPIADAIANANAANAADRAAYWAYQQAMIRQGDQKIAADAAKTAWQQAFDQAKQEYTQRVTDAGLTGTYNGQQTLAGQQQAFQQGLDVAGLTGLYNGQKTQAAIGQENAAAQALLSLQAQMQGPRNWARYQSTFGATPQGLQDVMAAYAGRYQLPTGTGAQAQAQGGRASVAGLAGDILSGTYGQDGSSTQALGNPRQADLQNWARMQPSQREEILGAYENQGWYGPDVENLIKGAAPRNPGASSSSFNFFQS